MPNVATVSRQSSERDQIKTDLGVCQRRVWNGRLKGPRAPGATAASRKEERARSLHDPSAVTADMSSDDEAGLDLFQEPEGYYAPEKEPTFVRHRMLNGDELQLRLVGHNPLWVGGNFTVSFY